MWHVNRGGPVGPVSGVMYKSATTTTQEGLWLDCWTLFLFMAAATHHPVGELEWRVPLRLYDLSILAATAVFVYLYTSFPGISALCIFIVLWLSATRHQSAKPII